MKQKNKKGFTLVELSIVLVIIGLLIGGILVGQSLIESAKMQSFIRQIGQYDAATAIFADKFGNLPGDNALFGTTCTGTCAAGNGVISQTAANTALVFNGEIGGFWADLSSSGLKNDEGNAGVFTPYRAALTAQAPTIGTYIPTAKIGTNAGVLAYGVAAEGNFYYVGTNAANTFAYSGGVKPADAIAIDAKLDNGFPFSGSVITVAGTETPDITTPPTVASNLTVSTTIDGVTSATACYSAADTLNASISTANCMVRIRMGTSTGVLQ